MPKIHSREVTLDQIKYNTNSKLFPFSPRREIDWLLVANLEKSIRETGNWQPVVIRAETFEGIAGNHRFLALIELATELGHNLSTTSIPVMVVECDEGMAITIALAENEHRADLTAWEAVRALLKVAEKKPSTAKNVFNVDGVTVEQFRLWHDDFDHNAETQARQLQLRSKLTREWIQLINTRLIDYPTLNQKFLSELRRPSTIHVSTIEELDHAITKALLETGRYFDHERTWNSVPTFKCLGCRMNFSEFQTQVSDNSLMLSPNGVVPDACPHLRIFTKTTMQFIPDPRGLDVMPNHKMDDNLPPEASNEVNATRGRMFNLLDKIDAYCVDPDNRESGSCFNEREAETAQTVVESLQAQGLPGVLPTIINQRQGTDEFVWLDPILNEKSCTPQTCVHRQAIPSGFAVIAQKKGGYRMACIHAECGAKAKAALKESESQRERFQKEQNQRALDVLRQKSIEQTLFLSDSERIDVLHPMILGVLETVLVPDWDREVMTHVVIGWQTAIRFQIATELELAVADKRVDTALRKLVGELAEKPNSKDPILHFQLLRTYILETVGLARWIACLAVVRGWKDHTNNSAIIATLESNPFALLEHMKKVH